MKSLKRSRPGPGQASHISSKVYVRQTRNGKVQKIVRELYLRNDIPCSSKLCSQCLANAPSDANGVGEFIPYRGPEDRPQCPSIQADVLRLIYSRPIRP